jgi:hypothetical protein
MKQEHFFYLFDLEHPDQDVKKAINKDVSEDRIVSEVNSMLADLDETTTFSSMVRYYMDTKRLTTRDLYERAYIDRRLFHKIIKNRRYHPAKKTVFALCIAFELDYLESVELLGLASYSFAANSKSDMILGYFLAKRIYDIDLINSVLYKFKCPCIGD